MIYLTAKHIDQLALSWKAVTAAVGQAVALIHEGDYRQPVKPYLRYREPVNRIIAMPAFLGGNVSTAGIKWIASFPKNIDHGLSRAHAVTILNDADTGVPFCIVNTNQISAIRTAGVTGVIIRQYLEWKQPASASLEIGITGFGPIGRMHAILLWELWGTQIDTLRIYDLRPVDLSGLPEGLRAKIIITDTWQAAYEPADIFITCTVSTAPYVNIAPKKGSLQANISLRDYQSHTRRFMNRIIVDDWEEICRENTDIEVMHEELGLQEKDTLSFTKQPINQFFAGLSADDVIMFNPMGMAAFDIAVAHLYYKAAIDQNIHIKL